MDGYESLEEGEIPSPPSVVIKESVKDKFYDTDVENSSKPYRHTRNSRKNKNRKKKKPIVSDFDVLRTKCLEKLKEKKKIEEEIASKEMKATEIDDVEMEDAHVITLGDSEEEELKKLRDHALSSQRNTIKTSDNDEEDEKTENEFLLRAEALKTAILKKRPSILKKKNKLNNRKHLLQNDNAENVKANLTNTDETCHDRVDIDTKSGKENLDNSENNDEAVLREQLLASIKTSNKVKLFLVDIETIEQINVNNEVTEKSPVPDLKTVAQIKHPITNLSANDSKEVPDNETLQSKKIEKTKDLLLSANNKPSSENEKSLVTNTILLANNLNNLTIEKSSFGANKLSTQFSKDIHKSPIKYPIATKTKVAKHKLISKNVKNLPKTNGWVVKKKTKDVKKLPITVLVPKSMEQRIVVNLGQESSDEDVEEPKKLPVPGVLMNSIDDFLSNARRLTETFSIPSTPEAVHAHLPPSQRIEYMKLKKQLAEKEESLKLKKVETKVSCEPEQASNISRTAPNVTSSAVQTTAKTVAITTTYTQPLPTKSALDSSTLPQKTITETNSNIIILPESKNKTEISKIKLEKFPLAIQSIQSSSKFPNLTKPGKTKIKKEISANTIKNNLGVFLKKTPGTPLVPTNKSKNVQQKYVTVNSNITSATQLMNLLKKELILEKNASNELAKLKLQVNCAEQKKKVHSAQADVLRSRIKLLLESSKLSSPGKLASAKLSEDNKRKEPSKLKLNDIKLNNNSLQSIQGENINQDDSPMLKKRKLEGGFEDYKSPLSNTESDINPLVEFCPHDLTGKCRDPDCQYQHLSTTTDSVK